MGSFWTALFTSCFPIPGGMAKEQGSLRRVTSSAVLTPADLSISLAGCNLYAFTFAELQMATRGFSESNFLGKGGFGPVYKGSIDERVRPGMASQAVAIKLLDLDGLQGHREWLAEVIFLGKLSHSNLVRLIGYCYEDQHRLLVYEYMAKGSLENHLFKGFFTFLPWPTRLKIAVGAAKGLAFLHEAEKPVIYRDFKTSNILLDLDFSAKLSDFGLAKDGPEGDNSHVTTRVMGTHGYTAPEYIMTGHLTTKSDVYSYGVVLLELLTGRRSVDKLRPSREQSLVEWARPYLNNDARKLSRIMDPCLEGMYSTEAALRVATMAYQCLSQRPKSRPPMSAIVDMLEPLLSLNDEMMGSFVFTVVPNSSKGKKDERGCDENEDRCEGQKRGMLSAKSAIHSSNVLIYRNTLRFSNQAV